MNGRELGSVTDGPDRLEESTSLAESTVSRLNRGEGGMNGPWRWRWAEVS